MRKRVELRTEHGDVRGGPLVLAQEPRAGRHLKSVPLAATQHGLDLADELVPVNEEGDNPELGSDARVGRGRRRLLGEPREGGTQALGSRSRDEREEERAPGVGDGGLCSRRGQSAKGGRSAQESR